MEDNVIKVSVRPNKQNSVKVSSNVVSTPITANSDTSQLWSQVSKNWAVSENIVDNTDYSSKHYAVIAKESAENAQNIEEIVKNDYNAFLEASMTANSELQATKENAITEIESNKINAVDSMNAVKNDAVDSINSTKTTILNDIEFVADGEKEEIEDLADVIKDNANTVNTAIEAGVERLNSIDALKNNQITNCILEIPQRIKLELNDGVLTHKAGSVVIVPNGFEEDGTTPKFDYVTVENDLTTIGWVNFTGMVFAKSNERLDFTTNAQITSGNSATLSSGNVWYDTVTNTVKRCNDGSTWTSGYSFPICLATSNGSSTTSESPFSSLDQTFNGMGYIGSTIWVDKGVKGLIPNGRNEDGTLRNIEYETPTIGTQTLDGETTGSFTLNVWSNGIVAGTDAKYDSTLNKIIGSSRGTSCFEAGQFYVANGKITSFATKQPVNLATRDMVDGQWIPATQNVLQNVGMAARTERIIDLSDYLPNDGYAYEIIIGAWVRTGATSGYAAELNIYNEFLPEVRWVTAITRTSNDNQASGIMTLPVGLERNFTLNSVTDEPMDIISLGIRSYRRIGTNL